MKGIIKVLGVLSLLSCNSTSAPKPIMEVKPTVEDLIVLRNETHQRLLSVSKYDLTLSPMLRDAIHCIPDDGFDIKVPKLPVVYLATANSPEEVSNLFISHISELRQIISELQTQLDIEHGLRETCFTKYVKL